MLCLSIILLCVGGIIDASTTSRDFIVDLGYAKYQGHINPTTRNTEFLSIRFAAPPTGSYPPKISGRYLWSRWVYKHIYIPLGNLRWSAPQPPSHTPGVQAANTLPNRCISTTGLGTSNFSPFRVGFNATRTTPLAPEVMGKRATIQIPPSSEDCLFLKYVHVSSYINLVSIVHSVYTPGNLGDNVNKSLPVVVWIHGYVC